MVAASLLQVKNDAGASCQLQNKMSRLQNIANLLMTIINNFMWCSVIKVILRHEKTCRNKLTLSSGTFMSRLKEKFRVFLIVPTNKTYL